MRQTRRTFGAVLGGLAGGAGVVLASGCGGGRGTAPAGPRQAAGGTSAGQRAATLPFANPGLIVAPAWL